MASLCHPRFTTTNLSYRLPIFETSATALCGTTGIHIFVEYSYRYVCKLSAWACACVCVCSSVCLCIDICIQYIYISISLSIIYMHTTHSNAYEISMRLYISTDPCLCQGRGGAWDHRRCGTCFCRLAFKPLQRSVAASTRHSIANCC